MNTSRNIAFFGGTFDPIHEGHLEIAKKAVKVLKLDLVIIIPCRRSPHKAEKPGASDEDRLKMLQLATAHLPWARVNDYEFQKPPPSYTCETVQHFQDEFPSKTRLFLLIGFDQWEALPRWKNIETLARDVEFIVVGRRKQPVSRDGYHAHFIEGHHPASASQIRADLHSNRPPKWLPKPVFQYISEKGLYSDTP
ncbi:MAG: nicotinate-nucleotide adenylyltransferase [Paracoccaceae bacterium]|jgi:nicotinate-nucleotide adenylyltransferase